MSITSLTDSPKCRWCGGPLHRGQCPTIAAIEFQPDGVTVKRVEFWPPFPLVIDLKPKAD